MLKHIYTQKSNLGTFDRDQYSAFFKNVEKWLESKRVLKLISKVEISETEVYNSKGHFWEIVITYSFVKKLSDSFCFPFFISRLCKGCRNTKIINYRMSYDRREFIFTLRYS